MIRSIGHVAIRVPDLDAAVAHATGILGLREVERGGGSVFLSCRDLHHELQLIEGNEAALDHVALEADGPTGLRRVRDSLERSESINQWGPAAPPEFITQETPLAPTARSA